MILTESQAEGLTKQLKVFFLVLPNPQPCFLCKYWSQMILSQLCSKVAFTLVC